MVEYKMNIWSKCFRFEPKTNTIYIASVDMSVLSDNEILEYVSDSLTHEHIHKILFEQFDVTTCKLFDAIQQHFRNTKLINRVFDISEHTGRETWDKFIKREGFNAFLESYHIDKQDIIRANITCKRRNINE